MRLPSPTWCAPALFALLGAALAAQQPTEPPTEPPRHLVIVTVTGPAQLRQVMALEPDLASCRQPLPGQRRLELIATDQDLQRLQQAGIAHRVAIRDLAAWHAAQLARFPVQNQEDLTPPIGQGAMGGHYTLAQMEAILDSFATQFPQLCSPKTSIGLSVEGRHIWMVKISDNWQTDENEPEVLYDALHHAREPLSLGATLLFMDELLTGYGTDPVATFLIDQRELYFVPCLNPDGYEYNRQTNPNGGGMWRKNRRNNGDGTFGIDLNRNYATAWSAPNGGSSGATNSDTYRGPAPFSEPETQAIEAFAASRQFVQVFTTHTYTDVLLRPWGWQNGDPANVADYDAMGPFLVAENGVQQGSISALLYIASGSAVDHHHTVRGSYAWTAELGRSNEGGFWPAGQTIVDIARRHQPMFRKVALCAGPALDATALTVTEGPGSNQNQRVEAGETGLVTLTVQNVGVGASSALVDLLPVSPGLQILTANFAIGYVPAFGSVPLPQPLSFAVPANFPLPVAQLKVRLTGGGRTVELPLDLPLVAPRLLVADDFEQDRGFARAPAGTATTGLWERSTPQQTVNASVVIQPGSQTTPGGSRCWVTDGRAGSSAGTYDVDGGYTDLWSPELDLRHLTTATMLFDCWYAESQSNDALEISVSRDGGQSWSLAHSRSTSTGAWLRLEIDLGAPLTDRMRLRVRAQDLNASLVEALIDQWELRGFAPDGALTVLGSGTLGSRVRLGLLAPPAAAIVPLGSAAPGGPVTFAGVQGALLLDPAGLVALPLQLADGNGHASHEIAIPNLPPLVGATFHFQQVFASGAVAAFGQNVQALTLR